MSQRARTSVIVSLGVVAVAGIGAAARPRPARAQDSADTKLPTFEVATVKPNKSGPAGGVRILFSPGGRFTAENVPLKMLIGAAFGDPRPLADFQIVGGPKWIESDRFDIIAKAEGDPQPEHDAPPRVMFLMLRSLLADRFKLVTHNETRDTPIFALVTARDDGKLGPSLKPSSVDCAALMAARGRGGAPPAPPVPGAPMPCGMRMFPGNLTAGATPMQQFATALSRMPGINRVVVDRTGLTGAYDFELKWTPDQMPPAVTPPPGAPPLPAIDPNGPSIFTAVQEQLGLKLESTKGPVNVVVIDSVEPPTPD